MIVFEAIELADQFADQPQLLPAFSVLSRRIRKINNSVHRDLLSNLLPSNVNALSIVGLFRRTNLNLYVLPNRISGTGDHNLFLADLIREIFSYSAHSFESTWRMQTILDLASQMYASRDFTAMPILADALDEVGCQNAELLNHCREPKYVHVRGCWAVDLVLGKT